MAINHCNHLIPLESYLLAMVLEQQKQIHRLQREFEELQESAGKSMLSLKK